jgi:hypothetical protein
VEQDSSAHARRKLYHQWNSKTIWDGKFKLFTHYDECYNISFLDYGSNRARFGVGALFSAYSPTIICKKKHNKTLFIEYIQCVSSHKKGSNTCLFMGTTATLDQVVGFFSKALFMLFIVLCMMIVGLVKVLRWSHPEKIGCFTIHEKENFFKI